MTLVTNSHDPLSRVWGFEVHSTASPGSRLPKRPHTDTQSVLGTVMGDTFPNHKSNS